MSDSKISDGGPAFPCRIEREEWNEYRDRSVTVSDIHGGMSLRAYAAIKLRVPESGIDWLDEMIRKAKRDEFAGQALNAALIGTQDQRSMRAIVESGQTLSEYVADCAYNMADAMLDARQSGGAQ